MLRECSRTVTILFTAAMAWACNTPPVDLGDAWDGPKGTFRETMRDDFDGAQGSAPNEAVWNVEEREFGQNQEQDYNTVDRKNSFLDGQGNLVIAAYKENFVKSSGLTSPQPYTSAKLTTRGKLEQKYGRVEMRAKMPKGKGLWPAFWLLGTGIEDVGWPRCGEIDVMELKGSDPARINGSMHGPEYSGVIPYMRHFEADSGSFADGFHTFTIEWSPDGVRWMVDGEVYHSRTPGGTRDRGHEWVFDTSMFVILNLAVGGLYDGSPDDSTVFPAQLVVDYVSVSEYVP